MIECKMYQLNANLLSLLHIHELKLYVKPLKNHTIHASRKLWAMFYNAILSNLCLCIQTILY